MQKLGQSPSRKDAFRYLCDASGFGNLGLFIGAGFCKAVLNRHGVPIALSWGELLEICCENLGINYADLDLAGNGFPQVASQICQIHASNHNLSFADAATDLKRIIALRTSWYPDAKTRAEFGYYLGEMEPAWIITTNYDLVIEQLLTGKSLPLGPEDQLTNPRGTIPVYHLHGLRLNPSEIIITQEDYVRLFRPNQYRQIKLALTVKESTTVFMGYGLGDVNVLTALDWSKNVFAEGKREYPHEVVQILRIDNPNEKPYREQNGILIIEVNDLLDFFAEYLAEKAEYADRAEKYTSKLKELSDRLANPEDDLIAEFINDQGFRRELIQELADSPISLVAGFITIFEKALDETWERARPKNAFEAYAENLSVVLDILTGFEVEQIPPALFQAAAYALERVAWYVGKDLGESYAAADLWDERKGELTADMVGELRAVAEQYSYVSLRGRLLATLNDE